MNFNLNNMEELLRLIANKVWCGIGFVIVPPDVDRQQYINTCFASETISIYPECGGTSFNRVPLSQEAVQQVEFPDKDKKFGSQVVYLFHPTTKNPIIIAVLSKRNELVGVQHKQFKLFKSDGENLVSLIGDGKKGNLFVTVKSTETSGGQILINLVQSGGTGKFSLQVQGDIFLISNHFELKNKTTKILSKEKISLGIEEYEPAVLGQTLCDDVLKPLFSALKQLKVATAMGPSGTPLPDFLQKVVEIENKLDSILSEKVEIE